MKKTLLHLTTLLLSLLIFPVHTTTSPISPDDYTLQPRAGARQKLNKEWKYFSEAGTSAILGHYDGRYFQREITDLAERQVLFRHLIRSYLTAFRALQLETWLAHGTLLGWWWNGHTLRWDSDLDMQVSAETLNVMAERYNQTMHEYHYLATVGGDGQELHDDSNSGSASTGASTSGMIDLTRNKVELNRTYLLDINPHHTERARVNGKNVIDARWVDVATGVFIDITGVAEREPQRAPGVWACKNNHRYRMADLWPMRETEFEGVPATVPRAFDSILAAEYGMKSLVMLEWEGHEWHPELQDWVKIPPKLPRYVD